MNMQNIPLTLQIGKAGINKGVLEEIKLQLKKRKIVKIKVMKSVSAEKQEMIDTILSNVKCKLVKKIGNVIVLQKA
ncbi:YhbY family RNA-binding protein [Candidatus Woesearchaeota archaeon]|nr:YhbY family RNA-binding protein [Candidatus Woesearchaeota archaeon]MBW3022280.1 YhbY family RNA-binding protein [Candidatus Woesearchaeota archaeon]